MLSTVATGLAIDAYGPISDNAGGIAEMAGMSHRIRERTDALDAAGNTTAVIGKGFAIGSAALVSLALFGAFVGRAGAQVVDVLSPKVFIGLIVGAMLPYWFSAMTMKSVGSAALKMVEEVRRQFNTFPGLMEGTAKPDYATCVKISTDASIKEMIPPGALVMLTPLIVGTLFSVETLSSVLAGALVSGVQIAISASNIGGAWDNAKKYIERKALGPKGSDCHKAAAIGNTIGDPLVFAPFFTTHGGLLFKYLIAVTVSLFGPLGGVTVSLTALVPHRREQLARLWFARVWFAGCLRTPPLFSLFSGAAKPTSGCLPSRRRSLRLLRRIRRQVALRRIRVASPPPASPSFLPWRRPSSRPLPRAARLPALSSQAGRSGSLAAATDLRRRGVVEWVANGACRGGADGRSGLRWRRVQVGRAVGSGRMGSVSVSASGMGSVAR
ncbi:hypothetical protein U9M48_027059 [Paspalum notatum var. saurae]|uniref:H(+)-exporting diphosphatase n=1 Tax=Paspalum notatum var. saurae TaxID=547442 RepID=A0AAQ3TYP5_PASNO